MKNWGLSYMPPPCSQSRSIPLLKKNICANWLQNCNSTPFTAAGAYSPKARDYPVYMAPDHEHRNLTFGTNLQVADVYFLIDTTGSMSDEIGRIKASLLSMTDKLRSLEREFPPRARPSEPLRPRSTCGAHPSYRQAVQNGPVSR